jgi:hypothetical protein
VNPVHPENLVNPVETLCLIVGCADFARELTPFWTSSDNSGRIRAFFPDIVSQTNNSIVHFAGKGLSAL